MAREMIDIDVLYHKEVWSDQYCTYSRNSLHTRMLQEGKQEQNQWSTVHAEVRLQHAGIPTGASLEPTKEVYERPTREPVVTSDSGP